MNVLRSTREALAARGARLRQAVGPASLALRGTHVAGAVGAGGLAWSASGGEARHVAWVVVALLAVWGGVRPGGRAPALLFGALAAWWVVVGGRTPPVAWAALAVLVAVAHLGAAYAAALPAHAALTPASTRAVARRWAGYLGVTAAGGVLVVAVASLPDAVPRGSGWAAAVVVAVVAGGLAVAVRWPGE